MLAAAMLVITAHLPAHSDTPVTSGPSYTVAAGDTLSGIAAAHCGTAADYPALAAASGITDPSLIYPGQPVDLTCGGSAAPPAATPGRPSAGGGRTWGVSYGYPNFCGDGDGDGWDVPCQSRPSAPAPVAAARPVSYAQQAPAATYSGGGTYSYAGLEQLWTSAGGPAWAAAHAASIAECESGGQASAYNPSGATGLWQILGAVVPGNLDNPSVNAANAVSKFTASGDTFAQWVCQ